MNADQKVIRYNCAIDAAMSVIEGRWKGTILCMLCLNGPMRFSELEKSIGGVTSRILSKQLRELEADRMIDRAADASGKLKVVYSLTAKGESVLPVLKSIAEWGLRNQCIQVVVPAAGEPITISSAASAGAAE